MTAEPRPNLDVQDNGFLQRCVPRPIKRASVAASLPARSARAEVTTTWLHKVHGSDASEGDETRGSLGHGTSGAPHVRPRTRAGRPALDFHPANAARSYSMSASCAAERLLNLAGGDAARAWVGYELLHVAA
jgi:hypothetical protein